MLAAEDGFYVQARLTRNVQKGNAKIAGRSQCGGGRTCALKDGCGPPLFRERQGEQLFQWEDKCGSAE